MNERVLQLSIAASAILLVWGIFASKCYYNRIERLRKYQPEITFIATWSLIIWTIFVSCHQVFQQLSGIVTILALWIPSTIMHCFMAIRALRYHYAFLNAEFRIINELQTYNDDNLGNWARFALKWFGTAYPIILIIIVEVIFLIVDIQWWASNRDSSTESELVSDLFLRSSIWMILRLFFVCVYASTIVLFQKRIRTAGHVRFQLRQMSIFLVIMMFLQIFAMVLGVYVEQLLISLTVFSVLLSSGWIFVLLWKPLKFLVLELQVQAEKEYVQEAFGADLEILEFMNGEGFALFLEFCRSEYSVENLSFFKDVYLFKIECALSGGYYRLFALSICRKYIDDDSPMMINLPSFIKKDIAECFESGEINLRNPDVFDEAAKNILKLLVDDTFSRFQYTEEYARFKQKSSSITILREQLLLL